MLNIWGRINSHNVKKVVWGAVEAGVEWQRHEMGGSFGYTEAYLEHNPNRLVPAIEDNGYWLYESNAILRYLSAQYAPALCAEDVRAYARGEMWMDWHFAFADAQRASFLGCVRKGLDASDPDGAKSVLAADAMMAILDAELATRAWLSGPEFGIADIPMGVYAHTYLTLPVTRPKLQHLYDWYARLLARPGFAMIAEVPLT